MGRLPLTDAMFLVNETRRTPMHVGGVHLFDLPEGVDDVEFLDKNALKDKLNTALHVGGRRDPTTAMPWASQGLISPRIKRPKGGS